MKSISFKGCGTALVTPFRNGEVDYDAFVALLKRQTDAGINYNVPLGTTGETPGLDEHERIKLLELTKEHNEGYGADAFLVVVPYYNKPTQQGMYEYFKAVAGETGKPVVIYNVPGRTGANMLAETTLRLAEIENIVAVKEASGNYAQISEIIRNAPEGFSVLSGNDDETLPLMATGASGIISVASNVAPGLMVELAEALLDDNMAKARELHHRLTPLFRNCFVESNPIPAKAALAAMGLISNELRLPLVPAAEKTYALMQKTVADLGL